MLAAIVLLQLLLLMTSLFDYSKKKLNAYNKYLNYFYKVFCLKLLFGKSKNIQIVFFFLFLLSL